VLSNKSWERIVIRFKNPSSERAGSSLAFSSLRDPFPPVIILDPLPDPLLCLEAALVADEDEDDVGVVPSLARLLGPPPLLVTGAVVLFFEVTEGGKENDSSS
jgi:hypothetical protein